MGKCIQTWRDTSGGPYGEERTIQSITVSCPECRSPVHMFLFEEEKQFEEEYSYWKKEAVHFRKVVDDLEERNRLQSRALGKQT